MWWKNEILRIEVLGENGVIASNEVLGQSAGWTAHRLATRPSRRIQTMGAQAVEGLSVGILKSQRNTAIVMTEQQCCELSLQENEGSE